MAPSLAECWFEAFGTLDEVVLLDPLGRRLNNGLRGLGNDLRLDLLCGLCGLDLGVILRFADKSKSVVLIREDVKKTETC